MAFPLFGGGGNSAPATPAAPETPAAPSTPAAPDASATPTATPNAPAPGGRVEPPVTTPAPNTVNLHDILMNNGTSDKPATPAELAASFMTGLQNQPETPPEQGAPSLNMDALAKALPTIGLENNIDWRDFAEGMNGENPQEAFQKVIGQAQQNVILAMGPIINELVGQAVNSARQGAVTATHQNLTSSSIVNEFRQRYEYGGNPAILPMLTGMANVLAQGAPQGTSISGIVDQLHSVFQGMGSSMQLPQTGPNSQNPGVQTDMSGIFN